MRGASTIGVLALVFYLFLPLEGILRKWVFADAEQIFGFVRDPVLIAIYVAYAFRARRPLPMWATMYFIFASLFVAYVLIFAIVNNTPPVVMAFGIRSYVLYIPLAFILGRELSQSDIRRIVVVSLYLSVPIALLVFLQFTSPVESPINKGTSDDIQGRFVVIAGIVRPYGPFTFAQGQAHFAALMLAITLIAWEKRRQYAIPIALLAAGAFSTLAMGALSGARTFFGLAALVCVAYVVAGLSSPRAGLRVARLASFATTLLAFLIVFVVVFPTSFAAMSERQEEAEYIEGSTTARALRAFDISQQLDSAPLFGYGAGSGSNAATLVTGLQGFIYGETEWGRMVNELGPLIGCLAILFRVGVTLWMGWRCIQVNRRTGDGAALILFGFSGYLLLYAQTTGQNQNLSFCWFAAGVTLGLCRLAQSPIVSRSPRLRAAGLAADASGARA
jgi:hypothetical protein